MCNILCFNPGTYFNNDQLRNMCWNNWHSYGLVVRVGDKLDIIKKVPESGEIDPEEVIKLLDDNKEYERFLHVRHTTAGTTSMENCHPFDVYYDEKAGEQVVFMHNGTLYDYKAKVYDQKQQKMVDDDTGASDTQNFVNEWLIPYISGCDFGTGHGDISHPLFVKMLRKEWPQTGGNRGLLISSKHGHLRVGDWKKMEYKGQEFWSSNDTYFDKLERGPEYGRRRAREEEERRKKSSAIPKDHAVIRSGSGKQISLLKDFKLCSKHDFTPSEPFKNIFGDWDIYDRQGAASLGAATFQELEILYQDKMNFLMLTDLIFTDYAKCVAEIEELKEKHENATKYIATLKASGKAA